MFNVTLSYIKGVDGYLRSALQYINYLSSNATNPPLLQHYVIDYAV